MTRQQLAFGAIFLGVLAFVIVRGSDPVPAPERPDLPQPLLLTQALSLPGEPPVKLAKGELLWRLDSELRRYLEGPALQGIPASAVTPAKPAPPRGADAARLISDQVRDAERCGRFVRYLRLPGAGTPRWVLLSAADEGECAGGIALVEAPEGRPPQRLDALMTARALDLEVHPHPEDAAAALLFFRERWHNDDRLHGVRMRGFVVAGDGDLDPVFTEEETKHDATGAGVDTLRGEIRIESSSKGVQLVQESRWFTTVPDGVEKPQGTATITRWRFEGGRYTPLQTP